MKNSIKILLLAGVMCLFCGLGFACAKTEKEAPFESVIYRPAGIADTVYVIRASDMNNAEYVMVQSLQGILAQDKAVIFIEELDGEGENGDS